MRDDNAMSNYFIAIEAFSNLGMILELSNYFQGSYWKLDKSIMKLNFWRLWKKTKGGFLKERYILD